MSKKSKKSSKKVLTREEREEIKGKREKNELTKKLAEQDLKSIKASSREMFKGMKRGGVIDGKKGKKGYDKKDERRKNKELGRRFKLR